MYALEAYDGVGGLRRSGQRKLPGASEVWAETWATNGVSWWRREGRACSATLYFPISTPLSNVIPFLCTDMPQAQLKCLLLHRAFPEPSLLPTPTSLLSFSCNTSHFLLYFLVIYMPNLPSPLNLKLIRNRAFLFHLWAPKVWRIPYT